MSLHRRNAPHGAWEAMAKPFSGHARDRLLNLIARGGEAIAVEDGVRIERTALSANGEYLFINHQGHVDARKDPSLVGKIDAEERDEQSLHSLTGEPTGPEWAGGGWRHGQGFVMWGTLRVLRSDFDTTPHEIYQYEMLNHVCDTLNAGGRDQLALSRIAEAQCRLATTRAGRQEWKRLRDAGQPVPPEALDALDDLDALESLIDELREENARAAARV